MLTGAENVGLDAGGGIGDAQRLTVGETMFGLMQQHPLLLSSVIQYAARWHGDAEVVSRMDETTVHRTDYAGIERRSRRLAKVLLGLGVRPGDRVATLAWNHYRHLELYWAISGIGAVCHTVNPRLAVDAIAWIMTHAGDSVLFADPDFAPIVQAVAHTVRDVVMLSGPMPAMTLPPGVGLHDYETLMDAADDDYAWPVFDENTASALCYTSGTTGRPKGVLYSHRSAVLHAMAGNSANAYALRATDRILLIASMYHVTGWAWPYCGAMAGASLVLPGRWPDGTSLLQTINQERITFSGAVPTVLLGLLDALRASGGGVPTLKRLMSAGSALPRALIDGFAAYGVDVYQAWGMTETSPTIAHFMPIPATAGLDAEGQTRLRMKQGRPLFGTDVRIVDAEGRDLPHDGVAFGDLLARGPWVTREYLHLGQDGSVDAEGWFRSGDVATIDPTGHVELVDRSKDVIKSGGEWISSTALEDVALSHPDVADAAVIAAAHPRWQERPLLLVVPREGRTIDPAALLATYEGRVAKWWVPDAVVVVESLPRGATGKLNKVALRAAWADTLGR